MSLKNLSIWTFWEEFNSVELEKYEFISGKKSNIICHFRHFHPFKIRMLGKISNVLKSKNFSEIDGFRITPLGNVSSQLVWKDLDLNIELYVNSGNSGNVQVVRIPTEETRLVIFFISCQSERKGVDLAGESWNQIVLMENHECDYRSKLLLIAFVGDSGL